MEDGLNAQQRRVLLALWECWKRNGKDGPPPSVAQIAKVARLSDPKIYEAINALSKMGFVKFGKLVNGRGIECLEATLTETGESLLPRIKELE
jgi:DNA-binding MarR family transcriptional regulator